GFGQRLQLFVQLAEPAVVLRALLEPGFQGANGPEQGLHVHRLLKEIGNPGAHRLDHVLTFTLTSEYDGFEGALQAGDALQFLNQLDTVHPRHMQIAQHQADLWVVAKSLAGLGGGKTSVTAIAEFAEVFVQLFDYLGFIVCDQQPYPGRLLVHERVAPCSNARTPANMHHIDHQAPVKTGATSHFWDWRSTKGIVLKYKRTGIFSDQCHSRSEENEGRIGIAPHMLGS